MSPRQWHQAGKRTTEIRLPFAASINDNADGANHAAMSLHDVHRRLHSTAARDDVLGDDEFLVRRLLVDGSAPNRQAEASPFLEEEGCKLLPMNASDTKWMTGPSEEKYTGRQPNFMIAGEQKAGTSYLYHNLRLHPDVFVSRLKEPLFFSRHDFDSTKVPGYLKEHFSEAQEEAWVGEASASYFHSEDAPSRIRESFGPGMKFIICLRHPTEKAVSLYLHNYRRGRLRGDERIGELEKTPFRVKDFAIHSKACSRFLEIFGAENVHFLRFDMLRSSPVAFVESALSFLGISTNRPPLPRFVNKGNDLRWDGETLTIAEDNRASEAQVNPRFRRSELEALHESMQEDVERTEEVTGLDLSAWKRFPFFCSIVISCVSVLIPFLDDLSDMLV